MCRIYFDYSLKSWYTLIFFYITMFLDILIAVNLEKKENSLDVILLNNVHKCFFLFLLKVIKHKWLGFVLVFSCLFFVKCPFWYAVWLDKHNCSASLIYNSILMWSLLAARYIYFQIMLLYPSLIFYSATRKLCIIISIRWHLKKVAFALFCLFSVHLVKAKKYYSTFFYKHMKDMKFLFFVWTPHTFWYTSRWSACLCESGILVYYNCIFLFRIRIGSDGQPLNIFYVNAAGSLFLDNRVQ